ncbi:MAG: hypothetical protein ACRDRV_10545 [Pseudonocardiaceae bacterium]
MTFQVYGHRPTGDDRDATELVAKFIREAMGGSPHQCESGPITTNDEAS